ncbi:uncharacterized protein C19orf47 homolog isoform X1 [Pezoporus occidentalis]|uniref:uncharacterized protein C19orf47 homolog isoform X1 n=1 Tax=Pezoporus occidentalis TaxID=407982 RepID=UPI002F91749B
MVSMTMATSEWIQFFKEAGIPPGPAVSYAVMFVDNRIRKNMLLDLTKELMNELGITVVGDVIAILKHAKVVYRQEMCKAATELLLPSSPPVQAELRRNANSAASRMIANSLSRDPLPAAPLQPHGSKISVTVPNQPAAAKAGLGNAAAGIPSIPVKRRRVTAEMEGKYIITMPKGTTPRTRKILAQQQAAKGLPRTSVFDRLGAEARGDAAAGGKPTGVFSRLGDSLRDKSMDNDDDDDDDDSSVLPYAGVLKKPSASRKEITEPGMPVKAKASSSEAKPVPSLRNAAGIAPAGEGREGEDGVSSSSGGGREKSKRECRVMIRRTWGCGKVSSSSEARMDSAGSVSVFQRLGKKSD